LQLFWQAQIVQEGKKHEPIVVDGKSKRIDGSNNSQQLYQPPKDKFSAKFSNNTNSNTNTTCMINFNNICWKLLIYFYFVLDTNRRGGSGAGWNNKRSFDSSNGNRRGWRPY
jgi:hypothetical protein